MQVNNLWLLALAIICGNFWAIHGYEIPPVKVEPLDNAFRVSIPDEPGIKYVAFNVNRNRDFKGFQEGEYSTRLEQPINNRWTYEINRRLSDNDVIYIWTNVQHNQAIYRSISGAIYVDDIKKGASPDVTPPRSQPPPISEGPPTSGKCIPSLTRVQSQAVCRGDLIFEDQFDGTLDANKWKHEVRIALNSGDAEFVLYDSNTELQEGKLKITPRLWSETYPVINIRSGAIDLGHRCTATQNPRQECTHQGFGIYILPPVVSARINTKHAFSFKYGRVEVRAKLPQGNWLVPLLLLEPLTNQYGYGPFISGQMRIAYIRSNIEQLARDGICPDGTTLYGGAVLVPEANKRDRYMAKTQRRKHFGEDFHVYTLIWDDKQLSMEVDGENYGTVEGDFANKLTDDEGRANVWKGGNKMAPLDQEFYLTLGVAAGGHSDFPDACANKPWGNENPRATLDFWKERTHWHSTWISPALEVDYIRVYAI